MIRLTLFILLLLSTVAYGSNPCARRTYTPDRPEPGAYFTCVCNSTYCDEVEPLGEIENDKFVVYISSESLYRLNRIDENFARKPNSTLVVSVNTKIQYQKIMGFGGAITDAVGYNLRLLDDELQESLMKQYFDKTGIQYTFLRTPVASCDFSLDVYSFNDVDGDFAMKNFNLTKGDFLYKIPYIKRAVELVKSYGDELKLFATAWSAPGWMKTTGQMKGWGSLLGDPSGPYYEAFAHYYRRYFEEYAKEGVHFWGMTPINEPTMGNNPDWGWQATYLSPQLQRDFIRDWLYPILKSSDASAHISIIIGDDQRTEVMEYADTVSRDNCRYANAGTRSDQLYRGNTGGARRLTGAKTSAAGAWFNLCEVHGEWYYDRITPPTNLSKIASKYPDNFVLYTEACAGFQADEHFVSFGNWTRAERYAYNILEDLNNNVVGWVDWNIVLDTQGGPNFVENYVDAPVIVNATGNEFIKQPMFYIMGHFSKFIRPGYIRVAVGFPLPDVIKGSAFVSPDGLHRVVVLLNTDNSIAYEVSIQDTENPFRAANVHLEPNSIVTVNYKIDL